MSNAFRPQRPPAEPPVTGNTPLHTWLTERGKKKLEAADRSSDTCDEAGSKQDLLSVDCQQDMKASDDLLVQNSIGQSPLHIACEYSDVSSAKAILEKYKELCGCPPSDNEDASTASYVSKLLNLKESKLGRTPLHVACSQEHFCPAIIILLVEASYTSSREFSSASPQPVSCLLAKDKNGEIPLQLLVRELAMFRRPGNWCYRPPPAMLSPEVGVIGTDPCLKQQSLLLQHVEEPFKKLVDATISAGLFPSVKATDSSKEENGVHEQEYRSSRTRIDVGHPINMTGNKSHLPVLSMLALEKELLPLMQYLISKSVVIIREVKNGEKVKTVVSQDEVENEKTDGGEETESTVTFQKILCVDPTARSSKKSSVGLMWVAECSTPLHVAVVKTRSIPLVELLLSYIDTYSIRVCQLCGTTAVLDNVEERQKPNQTCACRYDCAPDAAPCGGALVHPMFARDADGNTVLHACTGVTSATNGGSPFPSIPMVKFLFFHPEADLSVLNFAKSRAPKGTPLFMMKPASSEPSTSEGANTCTDGASPKKLRSAVANLDELDGRSVMSCVVKIASDNDAISLIHSLLLCASTSESVLLLTRVNRRIAVQEKRAREAVPYFMRREGSARKTLRDEEEQFDVDEEEIMQGNADDGSGDSHDNKDSSTPTKTICENEHLSIERPLFTPARLGFYDPKACDPSMTQEKFYGRFGSPLFAAVLSCNAPVIELLLASGLGDINERCAEDGSTILHEVTLSICRGRSAISNAFLIAKYGCDFAARDANGRTALDLALWFDEERKKSYEESEMDPDANQVVAQMIEWLTQHMGPQLNVHRSMGLDPLWTNSHTSSERGYLLTRVSQLSLPHLFPNPEGR